jgi:bifunctional UDP-N-acetylglucosamine pyrophosphorylase/glucosamine-1-phosphate N-acetyltransferase
MWPLDGFPGSFFVGGRTLRECQEESGPAEEVSLAANAWVAAVDWDLLLGMEGEAKLESHAGDVLAWKGSSGIPHEGVVALASEDSFLVSYPWDLIRVNEQVLGNLEPGIDLPAGQKMIESEDGLLVVGEGTRVLPGVFVEGTVVIGRDCKIGPNCYLRGSTAIGDGCHIGQAVEVKNSIIGPQSAVGHLSYVGDSILGSRVNFGAGTITSNLRHDGKNHRSMVQGDLVETGRRKLGTIVGDAVHTGIHTAIYPGRKLGPGTMTRPGETVERDRV